MPEITGYSESYYSMTWLGPKGYPEHGNAGRCYFTGMLGMLRVVLWHQMGVAGGYGEHYLLIALTVGIALLGVVTFGSLAGAMLPFIMKRIGFDPASASAPFVATLVDVTGLTLYFYVALLILRGTLL